MKSLSRLFLFWLLQACLSACVSHPYPNQWGEPATDLQPDGCSALAGVYANQPGGLFDLLTRYHGYARDIHRVEIAATPGTLIFKAYRKGLVVSEKQVSEADRELICTRNGAELPMSGVYGAQEVLVVSKKMLNLGLDASGNLLLKDDETGVGFYGVIPLPGSESKWYRFKRYRCEADPTDSLLSGDNKAKQLESRGHACYWLHDYDAAIALYSEALAENRKTGQPVSDSYTMRGITWFRMRNYLLALADLNDAIHIDPDDANAHNLLGYTYFVMGEFGKAAAHFSASLNQIPSQPEVVTWAWFALSRSGQQAEAKTLLANSAATLNMSIWPAPAVHFLAGGIDTSSFLRESKDSETLVSRQQACDANFVIGEWHLANGRSLEARDYLEKAQASCQNYSFSAAGAESELTRAAASERK